MFQRGKIGCLFTILLISFLFFTIHPSENFVQATKALKEDTLNVLVVFPDHNGEKVNEDLRKLDLLICRFTENIVFKPCSQVEAIDLQQATHLFYYGLQKEILPANFLDLVQKYTGVMVAIGYNVNQLGDRFLFMKLHPPEVMIDQILMYPFSDQRLSLLPQPILGVDVVDHRYARPLLMGKMNDKKYPLFVQHNQTYYYASPNITDPLSIAFAEGLHKVFEEEDCRINPCYIRLEDVHPLEDPETLKTIAQVLIEKKYPI